MKDSQITRPDREFAEKFRTLMAKRNARLADAARAAGVAVSTASTWRRGRMPKSPQKRMLLAEFLGTDASALFGAHATQGNAAPKDAPPAVFSNEFARADSSAEIRRHAQNLIACARGDAEKLCRIARDFKTLMPLSSYAKKRTQSIRQYAKE